MAAVGGEYCNGKCAYTNSCIQQMDFFNQSVVGVGDRGWEAVKGRGGRKAACRVP